MQKFVLGYGNIPNLKSTFPWPIFVILARRSQVSNSQFTKSKHDAAFSRNFSRNLSQQFCLQLASFVAKNKNYIFRVLSGMKRSNGVWPSYEKTFCVPTAWFVRPTTLLKSWVNKHDSVSRFKSHLKILVQIEK